jgi:hypothetical protein
VTISDRWVKNGTLPVLAAIERHASPEATGIIAAVLSLLLCPAGRARQQYEPAKIRAAGSVLLIVALIAQGKTG